MIYKSFSKTPNVDNSYRGQRLDERGFYANMFKDDIKASVLPYRGESENYPTYSIGFISKNDKEKEKAKIETKNVTANVETQKIQDKSEIEVPDEDLPF